MSQRTRGQHKSRARNFWGSQRDVRGVIEQEKAALGVLISMQEPTAAMRKEAASAGFYASPWDGTKYPKLQLPTVGELLSGKAIEYPV